MDRTPQSFLKSSASPHFLLASPPELLRPSDRFLSPSPSAGRGPSSEPPLPPIKLHPQDKMSIAAATHPPAPSSSLLSPPESPETAHVALRRSSPHAGLLHQQLHQHQHQHQHQLQHQHHPLQHQHQHPLQHQQHQSQHQHQLQLQQQQQQQHHHHHHPHHHPHLHHDQHHSAQQPHHDVSHPHPLLRHGDDILMTDEPLLPEDGAPISLETPLFSVSEKDEPRIRKVVAQRSHRAPPGRLPSPDDYGLFVSSAWRLCQSNPREWLRREQHYQSLYRSAGVHKPALKPIAASSGGSSGSKRSSAATPRPPRVSSSTLGRQGQRPARAPRATPKLVSADRFERLFTTPPRSSAADSSSSSSSSSSGGGGGASSSSASTAAATAASSTTTTPAPRQRLAAPTREDSNFEALLDLTPPLSSLPPHNRALLTDWRGNPLAIEAEPHFEKLHPAEAKLASTLRLTPAIYLSSKRRIFIEKVRRTRMGKEFRKTDSQKACKIDVNKASKLWTAFEKVGWFEPRYIQPHLDKDIHMEP